MAMYPWFPIKNSFFFEILDKIKLFNSSCSLGVVKMFGKVPHCSLKKKCISMDVNRFCLFYSKLWPQYRTRTFPRHFCSRTYVTCESLGEVRSVVNPTLFKTYNFNYLFITELLYFNPRPICVHVCTFVIHTRLKTVLGFLTVLCHDSSRHFSVR